MERNANLSACHWVILGFPEVPYPSQKIPGLKWGVWGGKDASRVVTPEGQGNVVSKVIGHQHTSLCIGAIYTLCWAGGAKEETRLPEGSGWCPFIFFYYSYQVTQKENCFLLFKKNYLLFYWSTVDLQCCVSFRSAKWFRYVYMHIYVFFFRFFPHICYYKILSIAPCTVQ